MVCGAGNRRYGTAGLFVFCERYWQDTVYRCLQAFVWEYLELGEGGSPSGFRGGVPFGDAANPFYLAYSPTGAPGTKTLPAKPVKSALASFVPQEDVGDEAQLAENMVSFNEKVEELKSDSTGEGVTIAILDSGINYDVLDIDLLGGYSYTGEDYFDVLGHGTLTASVIKGNDGAGVAPDVDILAVKVVDDSGRTTTAIVADAIRYAVDAGASVITMPFSLFPVSSYLTEAIDHAVDKGAVLIAAAGNESSQILGKSLAGQEDVITVGSVDCDGTLSAWSNYGSELDFLAPWDVVTLEGADDNEAGTSFSAAFIAGLSALVLSESPEMTSDDVLRELKIITAGIEAENAGYEGYGLIGPEETEKEDVTAGEKKDTEKKIKGVNIDEVMSMQNAQRTNRSRFTGHSMVKENNDGYSCDAFSK